MEATTMSRRSDGKRPKTCQVAGCGNKHKSKGLCNTHYQRFKRGASLDAPLEIYTRMTAELRSEIYELRSKGMSQSKIARQLGVSRRGVHRALQEMGGDPYERPDRACIIEWCDRQRHSSIGYCEAHLYRHKRGLPLDEAFLVKERQPERCVAVGCDKKPKSLGYCSTHSVQYRKYGTVKPIRTVWDEVTYQAAHRRCGALWGAARHHPCVVCGKPAADWAYDGTDPTERYYDARDYFNQVRTILPYSRFPEFYMPMCKACHKQRDLQELDDELEAFRDWRKSQRSGGCTGSSGTSN
jgi:transposase-like protein